MGSGSDAAYGSRCQSPEMPSSLAEERQHFGKCLFRGEDRGPLQGAAYGLRCRMALVLIVDDRNPVVGVGEDLAHEVGRSGDP
jgi:hypothetical protein